MTGTVKKWDARKGFGFIAVEGQRDVAVFWPALKEGIDKLEKGQQVEFELVSHVLGPQAANVRCP